VEIWAGLRAAGRADPKMKVQATTFDLWQRGGIAKLDRGQYRSKPEGRSHDRIRRRPTSLERMIEDVRRIRDRSCEPKSNSKPRYHALSAVVSQLDRAIRVMRAED